MATGTVVVRRRCGELAKSDPSLPFLKDTTKCRLEAVRSYPHDPGEYSPDIDRYMASCIAAKGYKLNLAPTRCGLDDIYENPFCYELRPPSKLTHEQS